MRFAIARPLARNAGGPDASHDVRFERCQGRRLDDGWRRAQWCATALQIQWVISHKSIKLPVAGSDAPDDGVEDADGADGNAGAKRVQFGVKIDVSAA